MRSSRAAVSIRALVGSESELGSLLRMRTERGRAELGRCTHLPTLWRLGAKIALDAAGRLTAEDGRAHRLDRRLAMTR